MVSNLRTPGNDGCERCAGSRHSTCRSAPTCQDAAPRQGLSYCFGCDTAIDDWATTICRVARLPRAAVYVDPSASPLIAGNRFSSHAGRAKRLCRRDSNCSLLQRSFGSCPLRLEGTFRSASAPGRRGHILREHSACAAATQRGGFPRLSNPRRQIPPRRRRRSRPGPLLRAGSGRCPALSDRHGGRRKRRLAARRRCSIRDSPAPGRARCVAPPQPRFRRRETRRRDY